MTWQIEEHALRSWAIQVILEYSAAELDGHIRQLVAIANGGVQL